MCVCVCISIGVCNTTVLHISLHADGRMKVLDCMDATQASPRSEMKENHPAYGNILKVPSLM